LDDLDYCDDVRKIENRCNIERGVVYWNKAVSAGTLELNPELMLEIAKTTVLHCVDDSELQMMWTRRIVAICGSIIDKNEKTVDLKYEIVRDYVTMNTLLFATFIKMDNSVTIERVIRCLEITKIQTSNKNEIAFAEWLAGCALITINKTNEKTQRAVRLVKSSLQFLSKAPSDNYLFVAAGEGCIAEYHVQRAEYELAEQWYRSAKKSVEAKHQTAYNAYRAVFSAGLALCQMRMQK
jgi:hypothetical protein